MSAPPIQRGLLRYLSRPEQMRLTRLLDTALNLAEFVREAWPLVEPSHQYIEGRHIEVVCHHLEAVARGQIEKLLINIPVRAMKSLLSGVFFPAWIWGPFGDPGARFIFGSYRERLAMRDSLRTRRIVESAWYQKRFPWVQLVEDQNEKMRFDNTAGGYRIATGIEGGGGGTGEGADYVVWDDPHNAAKIWRDGERQRVIDIWDEVMPSRTGRWNTNRRIVVMQRLHEQDLSGHILDRHGDYVHLFLPQQYDPDLKPGAAGRPARSKPSPLGPVDWRTTFHEPLWPQRFPTPVLAEMRASTTSYAWNAQHQQVPVSPSGGILQRHHFRYWQPPNEDLGPIHVRQPDGTRRAYLARTLPVEVDSWAQAWDFNFKGKRENDNDYVAGHVYAKAGNDAFLMDRIYEQLSFTETLTAFRELTALWPLATHKYYEDAANGPAVEDTLRAEIQGIIPVSHQGDDLLARTHAITHIVESGHVYLPHPVMCPWVNELLDLLTAFPSSTHDDDVAALDTYLRKAFPLPALSVEAQSRATRRYPVIRSR